MEVGGRVEEDADVIGWRQQRWEHRREGVKAEEVVQEEVLHFIISSVLGKLLS